MTCIYRITVQSNFLKWTNSSRKTVGILLSLRQVCVPQRRYRVIFIYVSSACQIKRIIDLLLKDVMALSELFMFPLLLSPLCSLVLKSFDLHFIYLSCHEFLGNDFCFAHSMLCLFCLLRKLNERFFLSKWYFIIKA